MQNITTASSVWFASADFSLVRGVDLTTQCGSTGAMIDDRWWTVTSFEPAGLESGPPTGWGVPHQSGTYTVHGDRAVFQTADGLLAHLEPTDLTLPTDSRD